MFVPRCGSIIVDLALKFNSTKKEQDVITTLNDTVKDGKLGEFSVGAIWNQQMEVSHHHLTCSMGVCPHNTS